MTKEQQKAIDIFTEKLTDLFHGRWRGEIRVVALRLVERAYADTVKELKGGDKKKS